MALASDSDILKSAQDWRRAGRGVAIATVVETWGSAPRPAGSSLVIDEEGNFLGSVSGGCVEGAVVSEAVDVIGDGRARVLQFGVADERQVGLSCGGRIRLCRSWLSHAATRSPQHGGRAARVRPGSTMAANAWLPASRCGRPAGGGLALQLRQGKSALIAKDGRAILTVHVPPVKLVMTGAVHISQALIPIAQLVVIVRAAFATPERFPNVNLIAEWPMWRCRRSASTTTPPSSPDPRPSSTIQRSNALADALYRRARQPEDPCQAG